MAAFGSWNQKQGHTIPNYSQCQQSLTYKAFAIGKKGTLSTNFDCHRACVVPCQTGLGEASSCLKIMFLLKRILWSLIEAPEEASYTNRHYAAVTQEQDKLKFISKLQVYNGPHVNKVCSCRKLHRDGLSKVSLKSTTLRDERWNPPPIVEN